MPLSEEQRKIANLLRVDPRTLERRMSKVPTSINAGDIDDLDEEERHYPHAHVDEAPGFLDDFDDAEDASAKDACIHKALECLRAHLNQTGRYSGSGPSVHFAK